MKVRWTLEAVRFLEAQEDYMPGLGVRILEETENKLRRFAGIHVRVPVVLEARRVRYVYRMLLLPHVTLAFSALQDLLRVSGGRGRGSGRPPRPAAPD